MFVKREVIHVVFPLEIITHPSAGHIHGPRALQDARKSERHKRPESSITAGNNQHSQGFVVNSKVNSLTHAEEFCSDRDASIMRNNPIKVGVQFLCDLSRQLCRTRQKTAPCRKVPCEMGGGDWGTQPMAVGSADRRIG